MRVRVAEGRTHPLARLRRGPTRASALRAQRPGSEGGVDRDDATSGENAEEHRRLGSVVGAAAGARVGSGLRVAHRIARYIQGMLSYQADVDLDKYFIRVMNNDQSISVIDPLLGVTAVTQLSTMIILCTVTLEALRRAGRKLGRRRLTEWLEGFCECRTGLTPSITFTADRRVDARTAYVVAPGSPRGGTPAGVGRLDRGRVVVSPRG